MVHGSRLVIDLCDTSPEDTCGSRRGAAQGNGGGQPKRRRDGSRVPPPAVPTILLSDGEESDADLARRLADAEERIRARERIREDERLARQFQEEEHESQAIFRSPHGHSAGSSRMPYAYGGRWSPGQLFGGRGRDPIGDDWLHGGGLAAGFGGHGGIGALGAAGLSALFGDGYHGYHSSPGGGGGMYGGGGRGRGRGGSFGAVYGLPSWARAAADANAHAAAMRRVLVGHAGAGRGRGGQQLAHLSFLDRDFGEADYEMLLALDDDVGPEKKRALKANAKRVEQLPSHRLSKHQVRAESPLI
jgi:hypothetical protein